MVNLAKVLKKKRDAEARLVQSSPLPVLVSSGGPVAGGDINQTIQNFITWNIVQEQLTTVMGNMRHFEALTDGDLDDPQFIFAGGDVLYGEVF